MGMALWSMEPGECTSSGPMIEWMELRDTMLPEREGLCPNTMGNAPSGDGGTSRSVGVEKPDSRLPVLGVLSKEESLEM